MNDEVNVTGAEILQFIEQWESLDEEKKKTGESQKDVMSEAKSRGYEPRILKAIIMERRKDKDAIAEEEALLEIYKSAIAMV